MEDDIQPSLNPLLLPEIMEQVLPHLDAASLKVARMVCRTWNSEVVRKFENGLRFRFDNCLEREFDGSVSDMISSSISSSRILRSVRVDDYDIRNEEDATNSTRISQEFFRLLRGISSSPGLLRHLNMECYPQDLVHHFLPAANEGLLVNLKELCLLARDYPFEFRSDLNGPSSIQTGALANLTSLYIRNAPDFPLNPYQLILGAASNLKFLRVNVVNLNLHRNAETLTHLWIHDLQDSAEITTRDATARMIGDVKNALLKLTISNIGFWPRLPKFQSLTHFTFEDVPFEICNENRHFTQSLSAGLKTLSFKISTDMPQDFIDHIIGTWIPEASGGLENLVVTGFPVAGMEQILGRFLSLTTISRLTIQLKPNVRISRLIALLADAAVTVRATGGPEAQRILEFKNGTFGPARLRSQDSDRIIGNFSRVVRKMNRNWAILHFKGFEIKEDDVKIMMSSVPDRSAHVKFFYKKAM